MNWECGGDASRVAKWGGKHAIEAAHRTGGGGGIELVNMASRVVQLLRVWKVGMMERYGGMVGGLVAIKIRYTRSLFN